MTVRYTAPAGGVPLAKSFSDDFDRADTTRTISGDAFDNEWIEISDRVTGAIVVGPISQARILSNQCRFFRDGAAAGLNPGSYWVPRAIMFNDFGLWGRKQFAQGTSVAASGSARAGLGVMLRGNGSDDTLGGYAFWRAQGAPDMRLSRFTSDIPSTTTDLVTAITAADGSVYKVEVTPGSSENEFTLYKDGTSVGTFTDNGASRLSVYGWPGLVATMPTAGDTQDWDDFSCGSF